jgi:hypothetical protein
MEKLPPVRGFWSLTLYNEHHFFHPDELDRCSFGTKIKNLHRAGGGSLALTASATRPRARSRGPTGPGQPILDGAWTPPPVTRLGRTMAPAMTAGRQGFGRPAADRGKRCQAGAGPGRRQRQEGRRR